MKISQSLIRTCVLKSKKGRKRHVIEHSTNVSIARMREDGHIFCGKRPVIEDLRSHTVRDMISDHSYRRVQLFYLTAVVYHDENCEVSLDKTISQVGKSSCSHCSAAHHAILPRLADNSIPLLLERIRMNPADPLLRERFVLLGGKPDAPGQLLRDRLIAKNSHFQRQLDSTLIMPKEVNEYDCVIEAKMRPIALSLIQEVSLGKDPYEATREFVTLTTQFLLQSMQATQKMVAFLKQRKSCSKTYIAALQIMKYQSRKEGHFRNVLNRKDPIGELEVDLEIITQQMASTCMPPKEHLHLGMDQAALKAQLIKA